jgi:hypothetical protein
MDPGRARRCALPFLAAILLIVSGPRALAQERPVRTSDATPAYWFKSQTWDYFGGTKKFGYSFDIIVRRQAGLDSGNPLRHRLRESFRPWFVWLIDPLNKLSIAPLSYHYDGGIRAIEANRDGVFRPELRSTIELDSATFLHDRVMLNNRVRFELRHYYPFTEDYRFLIRLRLRPRLRVSLNDKNFYDLGVLYAFGYSELAIHTGSVAAVPNVFNQSRSFLGAGYRFKKYMRVDAGYIYQFNSRSSGTEFLVNHGLMTYLQIDYLSAQYKDIRNGIRERRIERSIGASEPTIDPAILEATGPIGPEAGDGSSANGAERVPWWRRLFRRAEPSPDLEHVGPPSGEVAPRAASGEEGVDGARARTRRAVGAWPVRWFKPRDRAGDATDDAGDAPEPTHGSTAGSDDAPEPAARPDDGT